MLCGGGGGDIGPLDPRRFIDANDVSSTFPGDTIWGGGGGKRGLSARGGGRIDVDSRICVSACATNVSRSAPRFEINS